MKGLIVQALISGMGEGGEFFSINLIWSFINFTLFVLLLYFAGWRQIKDLFLARRTTLEEAITKAEKEKEEARRLYAEAEEKKEKLQEEIKEILERTVREAEEVASRIVQNAEQLAAKIRSESSRLAEGEVQRAKVKLIEEVSRKVEERAQELMRSHIKEEDHEKLVLEVISRIEGEG